MRSRRVSRLLAAVAAVFLAGSSVGATVYARTSAVRDCCKKRCQHDAPTVRGCCCALPATPAPSATAPDQVKPVSFVSAPSAMPVIVHVATPAACSLAAHAPPGCPLFLQRCTLVL
jgi:hypothetical protein